MAAETVVTKGLQAGGEVEGSGETPGANKGTLKLFRKTSLPASKIYSWSKKKSKPEDAYTEDPQEENE